MQNWPTLYTIKEAARRIHSFAHITPVLRSKTLDKICGAHLFFKCENFQKVGAFKFRGALNAVLSLTQAEKDSGVATHSSGNHAQALALAAQMNSIRAYIVMPENTPKVKKNAVEGYGAEIITCPPTLKAREEALRKVVERTGAEVIHPYNDYRVIAGQATAAKELLQEIPNLDVVMAPVGGGGLISGTALITRYISPGTQVIAAEPQGADDAYRSFREGTIIPLDNPNTIADGLLTSLGNKTFPIIREYVTDIIRVSDKEIINAMRLIWERLKIIIEPSSAVPVAAVIKHKNRFKGKKVGIILSGGNVDLQRLPF